jgi:hypothetical protein
VPAAGWPNNEVAVMALKAWLTYTGIITYNNGIQVPMLPDRIYWNSETKKIYINPMVY